MELGSLVVAIWYSWYTYYEGYLRIVFVSFKILFEFQ